MNREELIDKCAVALFTRYWQRAPDKRDRREMSFAAYLTIATDVLAVPEREGMLTYA